MNANQIDQAVARFIDTINNSAQSAAELAKKGVDAGMTFGSELITQVLIFNGIKSGLLALLFLGLSILIAKFVYNNVKGLYGGKNTAGFLSVMPDYIEPARDEVRYVLTSGGGLRACRRLDSDGDAVLSNGNYIYARNILAALTEEQAKEFQRKRNGANIGGNIPALQGIHNASDGVATFFILGILIAAAALMTIAGIEHLITVIKIAVAPYLYLMEYAVELKNQM